ncbi:MAG TPA: peptidylprolyl isomerase [Acidimicrobiales bacterium]|nr:peptidylprolyl isomerase [Acidimicrobiales bacterium]
MPTDKRQRQRANAQAKAAAAAAAAKRRANRRRAIAGGLAVIVIVGLVAFLIGTSSGGSKKSAASTSTSTVPASTTPSTAAAAAPPKAPPVVGGQSLTGTTPCPAASSPRVSKFAQAPPMCIDPAKTYTATFNTTEGNIVVSLNTSSVPQTVNNFVVLSKYHYYDGSSFDRIDQSIDIIQGGSPTTQDIADPGPGYTIKDEPASKFKTDASGNLTGPYNNYTAGDLVMARAASANSAAAQYFFVTGPKASALNAQGTYVVFGHVTSGLSILQNIETNLYAACPSGDQSCLGGAPSRVVLVKSITIAES